MWPNYPNLGADDRNQWDMFRAMPGGLEAITRVTEQLRVRGTHFQKFVAPGFDICGFLRGAISRSHTVAAVGSNTTVALVWIGVSEF